MFVGHLALALASKRAAPAVSLGWLMAGVTAIGWVMIPWALLADRYYVTDRSASRTRPTS